MNTRVVRRVGRDEESLLEHEWAANSYAADGRLDDYGASHEAIFDPTLRNAGTPFFERP